MDKKTECELVQDLLLSYADKVLNAESKKLVEKHLIECERCQQKLREIQKDMEENQENQKAQIDYLKRVRRKNTIKSVLMASILVMILLAGVFVSWYVYQFSIMTGLAKKVEKQFESENFYIEQLVTLGFEEDGIAVQKTWFKDGKYKVVQYYEKDEEIFQKLETCYGDIRENPKECYLISEEEKKARKEKSLPYRVDKYSFSGVSNPIWLSNQSQYRKLRLGAPFYTKISTDHEQIGRKYYVLELDDTKLWVDMDTGLPIMRFGDSSVIEYYTDTNIPKRKAQSIGEYHYEFETVTEEDVEMPDLEGYEVEEFDYGEYVSGLLKE